MCMTQKLLPAKVINEDRVAILVERLSHSLRNGNAYNEFLNNLISSPRKIFVNSRNEVMGYVRP